MSLLVRYLRHRRAQAERESRRNRLIDMKSFSRLALKQDIRDACSDPCLGFKVLSVGTGLGLRVAVTVEHTDADYVKQRMATHLGLILDDIHITCVPAGSVLLMD